MRLTYREMKRIIRERLEDSNPEACRIAIARLYHETGGNKWLNPTLVESFIKQACAQVKNTKAIERRHTVTLTSHELNLSLRKEAP